MRSGVPDPARYSTRSLAPGYSRISLSLSVLRPTFSRLCLTTLYPRSSRSAEAAVAAAPPRVRPPPAGGAGDDERGGVGGAALAHSRVAHLEACQGLASAPRRDNGGRARGENKQINAYARG
eukprot:47477-Prorocentrum_minimum.AAC.1